MRRAAGALLLLAGCTSAAEAAYREQVACLSQYVQGGMERPFGCCPGCCEMGRTPERTTAEHNAFRTKANEYGRALGKSPAEVTADARAFLSEIVGPDAHGSEERMEALNLRCQRLLAG